MSSKIIRRILSAGVLLLSIALGGYLFLHRNQPTPVPTREALYKGVTYQRLVRWWPRPRVVHVVQIDTKNAKVDFIVTPADFDSEAPLKARTTSQFLQEFNVQLAVNGDGFDPWWSRSPADYYPHVGDPVAPLGLAASQGDVYSHGVAETVGVRPTFFASRRDLLSFNIRPGNIYNAISGDRMLVLKGEIVPELEDQERDPRTAIGINRNGRYLYLVVVDGRQPSYSQGATFTELAQIMIDQGAYMAMNLDGGGSSTLVVAGPDGQPRTLNSPIDNYIPGRERPVANHLGLYIR